MSHTTAGLLFVIVPVVALGCAEPIGTDVDDVDHLLDSKALDSTDGDRKVGTEVFAVAEADPSEDADATYGFDWASPTGAKLWVEVTPLEKGREGVHELKFDLDDLQFSVPTEDGVGMDVDTEEVLAFVEAPTLTWCGSRSAVAVGKVVLDGETVEAAVGLQASALAASSGGGCPLTWRNPLRIDWEDRWDDSCPAKECSVTVDIGILSWEIAGVCGRGLSGFCGCLIHRSSASAQ